MFKSRDTALFTAALTNKPLPSVAVTKSVPARLPAGEAAPASADGGSALTLENVPAADNGGGRTPAGGGPRLGPASCNRVRHPRPSPASLVRRPQLLQLQYQSVQR